MNFFQWFKSLWQRDVVTKTIDLAKTLTTNLSSDQFHRIVDQVVSTGKEPISGIEKAAKVESIVSGEVFDAIHKMPPWVVDGFNTLSVVVKLAYLVAKLLGRIK